MTRLMLALLLAAAVDWTVLVPVVERSVVKLEAASAGRASICTAVLVERGSDGLTAAITAAHCVAHALTERLDLTVSGRTAYVVDANSLLDLAIVRYRARKDEAPIPLAATLPAKGAEVMVVGYPFGWDELAEQYGHIAQPFNKEQRATLLNVDLIFGDSGGAAVNAAGELVGINSAIVSQGPAHLAAVVSIDQIRDYLDFYHARYVK